MVHEILDELGPENVRAVLAQNTAGSGAAIPIGAEPNMTKGYAQAWLAWHDSEKAKRESTFRTAQVFWTRWAALAASLANRCGRRLGFFHPFPQVDSRWNRPAIAAI